MSKTKQEKRVRQIAYYLCSGELSLGVANEIAALVEMAESGGIDVCTLEEIDRWLETHPKRKARP
ncbi:hypothetical protein LCGC14_0336740 [marine sediment metagenome]|uniref:Uncharacterized protein n=1 Tax=marine sediment metagenome TaxID=412755 RepID=A0A0F9TKP4_9ZZZZ